MTEATPLPVPELYDTASAAPPPRTRPTFLVRNEEPIADSIASTLSHIGRLATRRDDLLRIQREAEQQLLHRIGAEWRAGRLSQRQLSDLYQRYKDLSGPGFSRAWVELVGAEPLRGSEIPNMEDGSYFGHGRPDTRDNAPPYGMNVVYALYDTDGQACYLGSTGQFRQRIKQHAREKTFATWRAWPCRTREEAYRLEDRLLREQMPYLNKRAAR